MSAWQGSTRSARLPADWAKRRAKVKARARGRCEAKQHVAECTGLGTDCDHVVEGDDHSLNNLQWLSLPCHKAKTIADAAAKRARLKLPGERHPWRSI